MVTVKAGNINYNITVNVKEYSKEYVENTLNDYVKTNVTKLKKN